MVVGKFGVGINCGGLVGGGEEYSLVLRFIVGGRRRVKGLLTFVDRLTLGLLKREWACWAWGEYMDLGLDWVVVLGFNN